MPGKIPSCCQSILAVHRQVLNYVTRNVVQILYFQRKTWWPDDWSICSVLYQTQNKQPYFSKHLPDFLVCNKGVIFICCSFCTVSSSVGRRYKFWEVRDPSCFVHCCVLRSWQRAKHTADAQAICVDWMLDGIGDICR